MEKLKTYRWLILLKGIIFILLSFFIFRYPVESLVGLAFYIGISLLVTGVFLIIAALAIRKVDDSWGWKLAEGIIDLLLALMFLSNPAVTAAVLPFVLGFWMMVYGVIIFIGAFKIKKSGDSYWWVSLLSGMLTVVIGYFITANLLVGAIAITVWIGLGILLCGIFNVTLFFISRK
ncbi:DUF308 domain-containing protein [Draconibacterium sp. IB214405]|uniref:HdeD family acid-resistance protein n=1 Tax=Draconibacterium sp. IB214405 TaxID=3097352 RepID=UPI002A0DA0C9|nr:DUF308 domain-containing protein [Draconibacterium sp. IB214405]MDX8339044.1 DUF308 domain-containing protein [Draconibacterium sp. IB214405]